MRWIEGFLDARFLSRSSVTDDDCTEEKRKNGYPAVFQRYYVSTFSHPLPLPHPFYLIVFFFPKDIVRKMRGFGLESSSHFEIEAIERASEP